MNAVKIGRNSAGSWLSAAAVAHGGATAVSQPATLGYAPARLLHPPGTIVAGAEWARADRADVRYGWLTS